MPDRGILLESRTEVEGATPTATRVWRMDFEKELIDAFDRVVHKDFPNPQRINCPESQILTRFATESEDNELTSVLAHVRQCAPCFDELREIRHNAQGNYRS
jgi:hypothetical protein